MQILGFTDLLYDEECDPAKREKLEIIKHSGKHLLNVINDILDFSKIEAGKVDIDKKLFHLQHMLERIRSQFSVKAAEQHLTFTVKVDEALPLVVSGDEYRIQQIILNILSNAFKFTEKGTVSLRVFEVQEFKELSNGETSETHKLRFEIADTGIGIPAEKQPIIFFPFEQVDASPVRRHGGTGLGLAITKRLVDLMGGNISFKSQPGVGSTFIVELLLPGVAEDQCDATIQAELNHTRPMPPRTIVPKDTWQDVQNVTNILSTWHILVVEDNDLNQMVIQELLKSLSLHCDLAANGEIALQKLKAQSYDLVLLDMQMPVMDGVETIHRIRADETLKHLYVIALTAHTIKGDAKKYMNLECDDYLSKPIDKERFREKIMQLVRKNVVQQNRPEEGALPKTQASEMSPARLRQDQQNALQKVIQGLKDNCHIFDPAQIYALTDQLATLAPEEKFQAIKAQLYTAAAMFDDQAIAPIVKQLEECTCS
jgi:CheY-like chemotaxis protein